MERIFMMSSCAVTGHRPTRFAWKYNEKHEGCQRLKDRLCQQFKNLYEQGVRNFYIGGALGTDIWSGEELVRLKSMPEYRDIKIHLALPFKGYDSEWEHKSWVRMADLRKECASIVYVGTKDKPSISYRARNQYMVDRAEYLVAVYDRNRTIRSGTGMTVHYAQTKGRHIIYIHPDTGVVTNAPAPQP